MVDVQSFYLQIKVGYKKIHSNKIILCNAVVIIHLDFKLF